MRGGNELCLLSNEKLLVGDTWKVQQVIDRVVCGRDNGAIESKSAGELNL